MMGHFSLWEIPLLAMNLLLVIGLFVVLPVVVIRYVLRSRSSARDELEALEGRIARLEAENRR